MCPGGLPGGVTDAYEVARAIPGTQRILKPVVPSKSRLGARRPLTRPVSPPALCLVSNREVSIPALSQA